jgi:hypothetical protein
MTKHSNNKNTSQDTSRAKDTSRTVILCSSSEVSAKVPDYIFDLLDDAGAFEVERHLTECIRCKEKYLTVLRSRAEALEKLEIETGNDQVETSNEKDPDCSEPLVGVKS